jgi:uncharacterized membrane protein YqjE
MAEPAVKRQADGARDQSIGSLVSLAVSDVSQLIKCEIDLAKLELKKDVTRLGIGGVLLGIAAFVGCLILVLCCFAFAYGLVALGIWTWAAFLIVAGVCLALAVLAAFIGYTRFRKLNRLSKTRRTVQDDLALLKRDDGTPAHSASAAT